MFQTQNPSVGAIVIDIFGTSQLIRQIEECQNIS